jgi:hypothetical protein
MRDTIESVNGSGRQKSYADVRRRDLEFAVGDQVLLKVSSTKGIVRFGTTGKLNRRYIGLFVIIALVGSLAYHLQLPDSMKGVTLMLRKYLPDPEHKIDLESITVQQDLLWSVAPCAYLRIIKACHEEENYKVCESSMD